MTKLAQLTPLFEMTAAELRQHHFGELLSARNSPFEREQLAAEDRALADVRAKDYDRAALRHQLWLARYLESCEGGKHD
jgi:hypothetical protein